MMRSMFSAVSGLRAHQIMADVIGNNIANVNTTGFKASRVEFASTLSQLQESGSRANDITGATNPIQVGLGVKIAATRLSQTPGASLVTGQSTDVSLEGDGFFIVQTAAENLFTRAGSFRFDEGGNLVSTSGARVQGWNVDEATGEININSPMTDIVVPAGRSTPPTATTFIQYAGNLSVNQAVGGEAAKSKIEVIDGQGVLHNIGVAFDKTAADQWTMTLTDDANNVVATENLTFDAATGALSTPAGPSAISFTTPNAVTVNFDFDLGRLTQYGSSTDPFVADTDGKVAGSMRGFAIDASGVISGVFSNGETEELGQMAIASFSNTAGLEAEGDTAFRSTLASGAALVGSAGSGGRGLLAAGQLESSNVELGSEFTNLIIAQRGFQANSRVITTSDQMIQDLVNLGR